VRPLRVVRETVTKVREHDSGLGLPAGISSTISGVDSAKQGMREDGWAEVVQVAVAFEHLIGAWSGSVAEGDGRELREAVPLPRPVSGGRRRTDSGLPDP